MYCKIETLSSELSCEHIIPQVLGGTFKISVVCKEHNERFGHSFEGKLKRNAFVATALNTLGIEPPNLAYSEARMTINLESYEALKGYIDKEGSAQFFPQEPKEDHQVIPEEQTVGVLRKQIKRYEKKTGKKVDFDLEQFDHLPYNIAIPICGTDIVFIKRKSERGSALIHGLDQPIPFRVIAKIALTHLAALHYPFVMRNEFDPLKDYIIHGGANRFVTLHTLLGDVRPKNIRYLPYHYLRIKYVEHGLAAIVTLFGTIKFLVFFEEFNSIEEFKPISILNYYHIYDVKNRTIFYSNGHTQLIELDDMLLRSVVIWGKYAKNNPEDYP